MLPVNEMITRCHPGKLLQTVVTGSIQENEEGCCIFLFTRTVAKLSGNHREKTFFLSFL